MEAVSVLTVLFIAAALIVALAFICGVVVVAWKVGTTGGRKLRNWTDQP